MFEYLHGAVAIILDGLDLDLPPTHDRESSVSVCGDEKADRRQFVVEEKRRRRKAVRVRWWREDRRAE